MWRLYPAYAISVVATFLLLQFTARGTSLLADGAPSFWDLATHLTLTHGYFDRYFYGIVTVYWSLALEFQLYLAYPIFLILFRKLGLTRSIVLLTIFSIAWRFVSLTVFHHQLISVAWTGPYSLMGFLFARMPEWLFGVWVAEWYVKLVSGTRMPEGRVWIGAGGATMLFVAILSTLDQGLWVFTDILFGLGFALVVGAAVVPGRQQVKKTSSRVVQSSYRWLVWVGTISYSLYLFHMQLSWFGNVWIQRIPGTMLAFALRTLVLLVSIYIIRYLFRYVEAPFLKAPRPGDKFFSLYTRLRKRFGIKQDTTLAVQTAL